MWYRKDLIDDIGELRKVFNVFLKDKEKAYEQNPIPVNVYENENQVIVILPLAGVNKESIEINYENNHIQVKTKKEIQDRENMDILRKEIPEGDFGRLIKINTPIVSSSLSAKYQNGYLIVTMDKKEEAKVKKINIA
jgi:HSP20 family protein